jgi:hypothetical protein
VIVTVDPVPQRAPELFGSGQHETKEESDTLRAIYIKMTQVGPARFGGGDGLGDLQIKLLDQVIVRSVIGSKA